MSTFERERAWNAYKKALGHFQNEMRQELRKYPSIDYDAKMNLKFKAMCLKRQCLDIYRQSCRGVEYDCTVEEFVDRLQQTNYTPIKNKNTYVLQYEEDLMKGLDQAVTNVDLLKDNNKEQMIFCNDFACSDLRF